LTNRPAVVLFTDYGLEGPYIGQVEAVLQQQLPGTPVIKLFSDLAPFDIESAACLLPAYTAGFPVGTVFVCVVDPGVGTVRAGVIVKADGRWFTGPNEGLFALLARRADSVECWKLPDPESASSSFHGRDVFAPVAAQLVQGEVAGEPVAASCLDKPDWPDDSFRVVYIDRFGNAMTGVRAANLSGTTTLTVNGHTLRSARTFADVPAGAAFWYENANGLVEIAVNRGRADEVLGLQVGTGFNQ
jgi:S-adenosylmethionine hydrolase